MHSRVFEILGVSLLRLRFKNAAALISVGETNIKKIFEPNGIGEQPLKKAREDKP